MKKAEEYLAAVERALGDAYSEPAADVRGYIDYVLGSGPMVVGHAHPEVVAAAQDQVQVLPHAMGDAFFHPGRVQLLERVAGLTGLDRAILGCSGSDAVDAALKTARIATGRDRILAFEGSYHGLAPGVLPRHRLHAAGHARAVPGHARPPRPPRPLRPAPCQTSRIYSLLTRHSTHPLSVRISESFDGSFSHEPVQRYRETAGCGIEGHVNGPEIRLGSRSWLESHGAVAGQAACLSPYSNQMNGDRRDACPTEGSIVHLAIDGRYRGTFVLASALRRDAGQMVRKLARRYELALLTGDNERERERFRSLFGSDAKLNFNQSPLDKLGFIRGLQDSGKTVMMVGEGLNDAGALKQSDVGVAVVEKVGAFSPASDVIMEAARVPQLVELLRLARRSARIVRLSFGISAAYNVVGVSIAAAGLLSPIVCAVLMPVSSVTVVLFACGVTTWAARKLTPKLESRDPKESRDPDSENRLSSTAIRNSDCGLVSDLGFPTSDLSKP